MYILLRATSVQNAQNRFFKRHCLCFRKRRVVFIDVASNNVYHITCILTLAIRSANETRNFNC